MVRDRVVIGCLSQKAREKLIQEGSDLTLEHAIDIVRTQEISCAQLQTMTGEDPKVHTVEHRQKKRGDRTKRFNIESKTKSGECTRCGLEHEKSGECPAQGRRCGKCNKTKNETDRDPVAMYKFYAEKRPSEMNHDNAPFYLAVHNCKKQGSSKPWFKKSAVEVNKLNSLMKAMAEKAGLGPNVKNHSGRKTMIQTLTNNNIPATDIMQQCRGIKMSKV